MSLSSGQMFSLGHSSYYHHWEKEQQAIETHKWYLSEKAGHDVGMDYAGWNWIIAGHRARWLKSGSIND